VLLDQPFHPQLGMEIAASVLDTVHPHGAVDSPSVAPWGGGGEREAVRTARAVAAAAAASHPHRRRHHHHRHHQAEEGPRRVPQVTLDMPRSFTEMAAFATRDSTFERFGFDLRTSNKLCTDFVPCPLYGTVSFTKAGEFGIRFSPPPPP
jgi:hypothetical protein